MVMDDFRRASPFPPMGGGAGAGDLGPKFISNFPVEQTVVFGSGAAAANNNSGNHNFAGGSAPKRGRERPRSPSPTFSRPPIAPNHFAGHQHDAGKGFGKSPDQQREEEAAKARRLLRFGAEFGTKPKAPARPQTSGPEDEKTSIAILSAAGTIPEPGSRGGVMAGQVKLRDSSQVLGRNEAVVEVDMDAPDLTSEPILGICPDMCPETERNERERKGDLDRFERVGGSRNQTSRDLAVKKYTRTAEKDAVLIRPLLVLKKTMGHLLSLLERDHEDDLLVVHSFLWDRMRAVRMDLRMQHIFTDEAIAMHEQMIRFHILAMHELCEFSEGEGISEVFNAHLNIEQMNKTSVDLFQMYDDHLKAGISVPSEAEFRGYYALLKLDKHPGYNVEPSELSLDLAKMTPEMRNSKQVRFARDVARACRAGNFVAFFRLARDATYLQACLMHAHFSKLRTQALASLHSGLQKNQGIPLSTAIDWLGMEGEDIDALLTYHGFSIKCYEEAYMVKEGPFLNKDKDFPTRRAQLVEAKRSVKIVMDVQAEKPLDTLAGESKRISFGTVRIGSIERKKTPSSEEAPTAASLEQFVHTKEEDMPDYIEEPAEEEEQEVHEVEVVRVVPRVENVKVLAEEDGKQGKKRRMDEPQFEAEEHEKRRLRHEADAVARRAASQAAAAEIKRKEEQRIRAGHDAEAYIGKQGIWFRKWRRRAATKALERHRKQLETEAALDTLSIGSPLWKMRVVGDSVSFSQRTEYTKTLVEDQGLKLQQMWDPLDIPNLVGPILQRLNPGAEFLAWRLLLSTPGSPSGQWVRTKLGSRQKLGTGLDFTDRSRPKISIAEEGLVMSGIELDRMVDFQYSAKDLGAADAGLESKVPFYRASGLLFVMNEGEVLLKEQARLRALIQTLPEGANVPLLVLSTKSSSVDTSEVDQSSEQEFWQQLLKLGELSTSRVSTYRIVSTSESSMSSPGKNMYFSDGALREGIIWLAKLCPIQLHLRAVHVVDLVREHVNTGLENLMRMPLSEVNPGHYIDVFNQGIRDTVEEIGSSASSFGEQKEKEVLIQGWSSKERLEALLSSLNSCALPSFPLFKPKVKLGSINSQKMKFEQVLREFLNLVEGARSDNLANKWEVTRLVQKGCTVEWSESGMKLVPKWAQIFRAIFAARLVPLSVQPWPPVYISRMNKSPLQTYPNGNESSGGNFETGFDFSGPMLLEDIIDLEYQGLDSVQSELASSLDEKVTELESTPPAKYDVSYEPQSRLQSLEATNGRTPLQPIRVSTLEKYVGYRLPQDSPFNWLVERDEESQAKRLRLACTESERTLDKMLAELKWQGHNPAESGRAQNGNQLYATSDLSAVDHDNPEFEHPFYLQSSEERPGSKREQGEQELGLFKEIRQGSAQNFLLALSPFEELLDKMVSASSRKNLNGSEEFPVETFTPNGRLHLAIEEYRLKYQELQNPN